MSVEEFWAREFDPLRPLPTRVEDMVIYELHVGSLGFGRPEAGTLEDAMNFLDPSGRPGRQHRGADAHGRIRRRGFLGVWIFHIIMPLNMPRGGRDQLKFFVRECHRRGIAVIMDVVYNHYSPDAERAEWMYDTTAHDKNMYYFYQGHPGDYPGANPPGPRGIRGQRVHGVRTQFPERGRSEHDDRRGRHADRRISY